MAFKKIRDLDPHSNPQANDLLPVALDGGSETKSIPLSNVILDGSVTSSKIAQGAISSDVFNTTVINDVIPSSKVANPVIDDAYGNSQNIAAGSQGRLFLRVNSGGIENDQGPNPREIDASADINATNDTLTVQGHGLIHHGIVNFSALDSSSMGLSLTSTSSTITPDLFFSTDFKVDVVDGNTIRLLNADNTSEVYDIQGTYTGTIILNRPIIVAFDSQDFHSPGSPRYSPCVNFDFYSVKQAMLWWAAYSKTDAVGLLLGHRSNTDVWWNTPTENPEIKIEGNNQWESVGNFELRGNLVDSSNVAHYQNDTHTTTVDITTNTTLNAAAHQDWDGNDADIGTYVASYNTCRLKVNMTNEEGTTGETWNTPTPIWFRECNGEIFNIYFEFHHNEASTVQSNLFNCFRFNSGSYRFLSNGIEIVIKNDPTGLRRINKQLPPIEIDEDSKVYFPQYNAFFFRGPLCTRVEPKKFDADNVDVANSKFVFPTRHNAHNGIDCAIEGLYDNNPWKNDGTTQHPRANTRYYVVNADKYSFQISETENGTPVTFASDPIFTAGIGEVRFWDDKPHGARLDMLVNATSGSSFWLGAPSNYYTISVKDTRTTTFKSFKWASWQGSGVARSTIDMRFGHIVDKGLREMYDLKSIESVDTTNNTIKVGNYIQKWRIANNLVRFIRGSDSSTLPAPLLYDEWYYFSVYSNSEIVVWDNYIGYKSNAVGIDSNADDDKLLLNPAGRLVDSNQAEPISLTNTGSGLNFVAFYHQMGSRISTERTAAQGFGLNNSDDTIYIDL